LDLDLGTRIAANDDMARFRLFFALPAFLAFTSCGDEADEDVADTQNQFLKACEDSGDCGEFKCVCGVCTLACEDEEECRDRIGGATCVRSDDLEECETDLDRICVAGCSDEDDCRKDQACVDRLCFDIPEGVRCRDYEECDVDTPCEDGDHCIAFPACGGALCIDPEAACALSCPNSDGCALAESYPEQLFCDGKVDADPGDGLNEPPGVSCDAYDTCAIGETCDGNDADCVSIRGCPEPICIDPVEACDLSCPNPNECEIAESYPLQIGCEGMVSGKPGDGPGSDAGVVDAGSTPDAGESPTPDASTTDAGAWSCADQNEEVCKMDFGCSPITDLEGDYRGCHSIDSLCDDALTCAENEDGELVTFPDSCIPEGWTERSYAECEPEICSELNELDCEETMECSSLRDISGTFFECTLVQECGEAETCAEGPAGSVLFPTTCLPTGYEAGGDVEVCEGQALCGFIDTATECDDNEDCFPVAGSRLGFLACLVNQGCGDAITCGVSPSGDEDEFIDTCLPPGWLQCDQ
jgi:hypothetical protein